MYQSWQSGQQQFPLAAGLDIQHVAHKTFHKNITSMGLP